MTVNSDIFARTLFSRIAFKDIIICDVKISRLGHNLPLSVKRQSGFISSFREGYIFTKLRREDPN